MHVNAACHRLACLLLTAALEAFGHDERTFHTPHPKRFAVASVMIVSEMPPTQKALSLNANTRGRNDSPHLYKSVAATIARANHEAYCRRHGYHCEMVMRYSDLAEDSAAKHQHRRGSFLWAKVPLITILLRKGYAGVLTIDSDAVVTNMGITIESMLE
tara:strand:+ start:141 stop:617 length:477 start_codon:yes stop_codon:yes gene_type:complete